MPQLGEILEEYQEEFVVVQERLRAEEGMELVLVWERENRKNEIKLV